MIDPVTGCWNWTGKPTWVGYGQFQWDGYVAPAHRHAYLEFKAELEAGEVVKHRCDNKLCCNPDHLDAGTQRDNVIEMRMRCPPKSALDDATVLAIFADKRKTRIVAEEYGVSGPRVSSIRCGKSYCYLTGYDTRRARQLPPVDLRRITFAGKTQSAREWSLELGLSAGTVGRRLSDGWSLEKALRRERQPGGRPKRS